MVIEPMVQYGSSNGFDQVWQLFLETDMQFKETREQIKEND